MFDRIGRGLRTAVLAVAGLAAAPLAWSADPFTVTGIHIDETASDATRAQTLALQSGQVQAARILIERLTLPEDRIAAPLDPRDAAGAPSMALDAARSVDPVADAVQQIPRALPEIDSEIAASLIAGFDISNERRSPTRYIGDLSVTFDRRAVRDFFNRYDVPYVQAQARAILVVPILQSETGSVLWGGPWYQAWQSPRFAHALVPFIGLGSRYEETAREDGSGSDADDPAEIAGEDPARFDSEAERMEGVQRTPLGRRMLSTGQAQSLDEGALRAMADLYEVDRVAVIAARAGGGAVRAGGVLLDFTGEEARREPIATIDVPGRFQTAAARIVEATESAWKRETIVREAGENTLEVTVLYDSLREWRDLQNAVAGASLVSDARLDALSPTGAVMTLAYRGELDQVASELDSRGARLEDTSDLGWTVTRTR